MSERANIDDEAKRQKNLRLAEFFATWGSTPGATLVAGMTAFKKTIPSLVEDEKERKKAIREADKIIYELGQSERLEKKGDLAADEATKTRLAERASKLNTTVADLASKRESAAATQASHTYSAQMGVRGHEISAKATTDAAAITARAHAEATKEARIAREKGTLGNLYQSAQALVETTNRNIDHARATNSAYVNALRLIRIEPKNDEERKIVASAQKTITDFDKEQEKRLIGPMARVEALGRELERGMPALAAPARTDMPTSMTRADVEATAKASRKSVQEVEAMAKARGITIN